MEGTDSLSDAEMRFVTINGQTIMLEGDLGNLNMTNELLNEMLMENTSKQGNESECMDVDDNPCANGGKDLTDESTRIEITIQGENNELQTIQISVEEAKALGLYIQGIKEDGAPTTWKEPCILNNEAMESQEQMSVVSINNSNQINVNCQIEVNKPKLESMPLLDSDCSDKEQSVLLPDDVANEDVASNNNLNNFELAACNDTFTSDFSKSGVAIHEENSSDNLPAIGHLEGFQIPAAEDGTLIPATVNAKMADGSYQMLTLIPQIVDGNVTYTIQFANFDSDENDGKSVNDSAQTGQFYSEPLTNGNETDNKNEKSCKSNVIEEFLNSVKKRNQHKNKSSDSVQQVTEKNNTPNFLNLSSDENILKINDSSNFTASGNINFNGLSGPFSSQAQTPIETKINNLITENENVINKCKKVKYGKKPKEQLVMQNPDLLNNINTTIKMNSVAKKVHFKNKSSVKLGDEVESKKMKLSLLKPNNDQVTSVKLNEKKPENHNFSPISTNNTLSQVKLNCRLDFPNVKALDEPSSNLSYLKIKSQTSSKQPYFNILSYPKEKAVLAQRQILPINCDIQQAKSLISLQKFLESQKLQLKIQPITSNGTKVVNIRPKPTLGDQIKKVQDSTANQINSSSEKGITNSTVLYPTQTSQQNYQENSEKLQAANSKDVLLNDGKINFMKFLKPVANESSDNMDSELKSNFNGKNDIFIKNDPEYFNSNHKEGKMEEHPLGSTENPIRLVQNGHTFHSRQPLSETQLREIASILQKQNFDSSNVKKISIFDPKTRTTIVYRVVYPEDVELRRADDSGEGVQKKKRGRHRIKPLPVDDEVQKRRSPLLTGPRGPGRPKKTPAPNLEEEVVEDEVEDTSTKKKIPRTRSGRLSRPPRYMVKDYKRLHNVDITDKNATGNFEPENGYTEYQNEKEITKEPVEPIPVELEANLLPGLRPQQRSKRNFKPEYRCPTCQKIYLGHTRMMWHLNKFPDHCNIEKYKEVYYRKRTETKVRRATRRLNLCDVSNKIKQILSSMPKDELASLCGPLLAEALSVWDFLLLRVNLLKDDMKGEVDTLLQELAVLLEKLTKIAEDLLFPVYSKEAEKDNELVEIDRREIAMALGLPTGVYRINHNNLSLIRVPVKNASREQSTKESNATNSTYSSKLFSGQMQNSEENASFLDKNNPTSWEDGKTEKKLDDSTFWMEEKGSGGDSWQEPSEESSVKTLATKFEPNLSTKLLESSNDSIEDTKYEEPVQLIDLDSNSKDIEHSNSSENLDGSPKDHSENSESIEEKGNDKVSSELWNENSNITAPSEKAPPELWSENSNIAPLNKKQELWHGNGEDNVKNSELWNENSNDSPNEKLKLWNENSANGKVDETNSEFLDTLLSVQNSTEFLGNGILTDNMSLMNDKEKISEEEKVSKNGTREENFMRIWETGKSNDWVKDDSEILSDSLHERMPGLRTANRLTSTPETNGNITFNIPNRRNSISDFSNINLESSSLDMVLPPAKTLIKERTKSDKISENLPNENFLEESDNLKNWNENGKTDFSASNVNSEDLMKMALESLTSHNDVINVPPTSFDSAMGILNPSQEASNLNLFTSSETDGLDFNLPLPEHLLRTNFTTNNSFTNTNFQTTCTSNFSNSVSPTFMSTSSNLFGGSPAIPKFDQFDSNFSNKKTKLDDVMEFFDSKNIYDNSESNNINNFSFVSSTSSHSDDQFNVSQCLHDSAFVPENEQSKDKKLSDKNRVKKIKQNNKSLLRTQKTKKLKSKKVEDFTKSSSIESIINEALFESCSTKQMDNSSPNGSNANATDNYTLPIIPESLDEVGNLDFLNQD